MLKLPLERRVPLLLLRLELRMLHMLNMLHLVLRLQAGSIEQDHRPLCTPLSLRRRAPLAIAR